MSSLVFDTHAFVRRLRSAGFTEELAEIFADERLIEDRLATQQDIKELETRLETRMAEVKAELIKRMIGLLFVQAGFIAAMITL